MTKITKIMVGKLNNVKNPGKLFGFNNHCYFYGNPFAYKNNKILNISKCLYNNSLPWSNVKVGFYPTLNLITP